MFDITYDFTVLDIMLVSGAVVFILAVIIARLVFNRSQDSEVDKKFIRERWRKIEQLCSYGQEMNYKLAIIEADKLLEYVLGELHFGGGSLSDRLKLAAYKFPELRNVRWAHRVRNKVVHEVKYAVTSGETKKVLKAFKLALKSLRCL